MEVEDEGAEKTLERELLKFRGVGVVSLDEEEVAVLDVVSGLEFEGGDVKLFCSEDDSTAFSGSGGGEEDGGGEFSGSLASSVGSWTSVRFISEFPPSVLPPKLSLNIFVRLIVSFPCASRPWPASVEPSSSVVNVSSSASTWPCSASKDCRAA